MQITAFKAILARRINMQKLVFLNFYVGQPVSVRRDRQNSYIYLTIILRNRAEYRLILSRRGRGPSGLKSDDIPRD